MKMYDITRSLSQAVAVWPGDRPFTHEWTARIEEGSSVNIGAVSLSTHTGTHADAPLHFAGGGASIDQIPLSHFVGPAIVVDVGEAASIELIHVEDLYLSDIPRILFRTISSLEDDASFRRDFAFVNPDVVHFLAGKGVVLIGTDAPSVDPFDSKDLPAHLALAEEGIVNIENLALADVEPGYYQLYALPVKLIGLDAAPVRAILVR